MGHPENACHFWGKEEVCCKWQIVDFATICLKNQTSDADLPTNNTSQPGGVKSLVD